MVTGSLKETSDKAFPFYIGVSTRHFKGITGDFNQRRLSWWPEIPVSRFCVFTDWLKVDVHCFPHALIGWNNATAWKPSTFVLALFLQHFILICWCFFALSVFRATTFYSRWIMIQGIEVFIRTVSVIWTARPNMNSIYWFENRPMKLAWACIDLHVPFGHSLASRCKSTQVKLARTCIDLRPVWPGLKKAEGVRPVQLTSFVPQDSASQRRHPTSCTDHSSSPVGGCDFDIPPTGDSCIRRLRTLVPLFRFFSSCLVAILPLTDKTAVLFENEVCFGARIWVRKFEHAYFCASLAREYCRQNRFRGKPFFWVVSLYVRPTGPESRLQPLVHLISMNAILDLTRIGPTPNSIFDCVIVDCVRLRLKPQNTAGKHFVIL